MDIPRTIETYQGHKRHAWHTSQKLGVCQPGIQFVNCKGLSHRHLRLVWHTRDLSGTPETYLGHHGYATDNRDVSGIQETCLTHHTVFGDVSAWYTVCELWRFKLSKAEFWLKKVESQLARPKDLLFSNQEIRQPEPWNFARWEILLLVPGKVLWQKCIGGLGAEINRNSRERATQCPPLADNLIAETIWS